MPVRPSILLIFALAAGFSAPAAAKEKEERVWTLSGLDKKKAEDVSLVYAVPESDYITITFGCKPKSGMVDVFISETGPKLKPGRKATATLAAGDAKATFPGKLLVNEDAGVPSFEGSLPAKEPLFAAVVGGAGTLAITVGPSTDTVTLKGAGEKFSKFNAACSKP
jgi:hypothetical protein